MVADRIKRVADPAAEPLSLADAKEHLRVDETADDDYITALIEAAREYVEDDSGLALITQDWEIRLPRFPAWKPFAFALPRGPLQSIVSVKYLDRAGAEQTVADPTTLYRVFPATSRLIPVKDFTAPDHLAADDAVRITWRAGYGDAATDVPTKLVQAIKLVLAALYERRGDGESLKLPDAYAWLIAGSRKIAV